MSRIVSHLRIAAIAVLVLFALLSATALAKSTHKLKRSPDTFVKGPHKKGPMGRKEAGKTIPMTGGTLSLGAFYVEVSVGTGAGAATFDAIVDTGSSNTAVPAAGCSACVESSGYNFTASPTGQPVTADSAACQNCRPTELGQGAVTKAEDQWCPYGHGAAYSKNNSQCGFSVSYGGSSSGIAGFVSQDVVCLGGATSATGSCSKSAFIGSIEEEYPMGTINSGIVGLAYPANACNPTCQPTLLDSLVASGTLAADENKFGMCLTKTTGGILDLGYFNETRAKGELQWTDIVVEHWYNINCTNMLVGGVDTGVPSFLFDVRNDAIGTFVDSGTSILLMSPFAFGQLTQTVLGLPQYASLDGASVLFGGGANACYTFANVSVISQYPLVEFVLAGSKGGEDFKIGIDAANYLTPNPEIPGEFCLAIQGVASLGVIFGDVIMQRYYIAFDRVGRRLGFAPIANCEM